AIAAMMRFSTAGSSGRLSGVIGTPAVDQIRSPLGRLNHRLSQFAAACRRAKLSRPAPAATFVAASASRSLEQHRELCPAQHHNTLLSPRPYESATLQALGEQAQPVAIPPQQLDQITAPAA